MLETLEHAKARGARILAEVVGYGATSDAFHITSPAEDGEGAARAMQFAIDEAEIRPDDVDYINATERVHRPTTSLRRKRSKQPSESTPKT